MMFVYSKHYRESATVAHCKCKKKVRIEAGIYTAYEGYDQHEREVFQRHLDNNKSLTRQHYQETVTSILNNFEAEWGASSSLRTPIAPHTLLCNWAHMKMCKSCYDDKSTDYHKHLVLASLRALLELWLIPYLQKTRIKTTLKRMIEMSWQPLDEYGGQAVSPEGTRFPLKTLMLAGTAIYFWSSAKNINLWRRGLVDYRVFPPRMDNSKKVLKRSPGYTRLPLLLIFLGFKANFAEDSDTAAGVFDQDSMSWSDFFELIYSVVPKDDARQLNDRVENGEKIGVTLPLAVSYEREEMEFIAHLEQVYASHNEGFAFYKDLSVWLDNGLKEMATKTGALETDIINDLSVALESKSVIYLDESNEARPINERLEELNHRRKTFRLYEAHLNEYDSDGLDYADGKFENHSADALKKLWESQSEELANLFSEFAKRKGYQEESLVTFFKAYLKCISKSLPDQDSALRKPKEPVLIPIKTLVVITSMDCVEDVFADDRRWSQNTKKVFPKLFVTLKTGDLAKALKSFRDLASSRDEQSSFGVQNNPIYRLAYKFKRDSMFVEPLLDALSHANASASVNTKLRPLLDPALALREAEKLRTQKVLFVASEERLGARIYKDSVASES